MLLFLISCTTPVSIEQAPAPDNGPDTTPQDTAAPDTEDTDDTEPPTNDTGVESIEGSGEDDSWIYNPDIVHTLDIGISSKNIEILNDKSGAYSSETVWVDVDITYDGIAMEDVGLRLKGRWGSWRSFEDKPSLKLDFNRYVDGQEFAELEGMTLNNMIIDCSFMREHMAYPVYEAMGVPVPRTAYVWVTVNGADYGLYLNIESIDDVYLDRHHEDGNGTLYLSLIHI